MYVRHSRLLVGRISKGQGGWMSIGNQWDTSSAPRSLASMKHLDERFRRPSLDSTPHSPTYTIHTVGSRSGLDEVYSPLYSTHYFPHSSPSCTGPPHTVYEQKNSTPSLAPNNWFETRNRTLLNVLHSCRHYHEATERRFYPKDFTHVVLGSFERISGKATQSRAILA